MDLDRLRLGLAGCVMLTPLEPVYPWGSRALLALPVVAGAARNHRYQTPHCVLLFVTPTYEV